MKHLPIKNRVILLTGAASGIGAALALELSRKGSHLALVDINGEKLAAVASLARSQGVRVSEHVCDLGESSHISALSWNILREHPGVSILINNAGVVTMGSFQQQAAEDFEWLINVNLLAPIRLTRNILPLLLAEPTAHIVNVSSICGLAAVPGLAAYSTSKFGLRGFSESLRSELRGTNVGVTTVHPGCIRTPIAINARAAQSFGPQAREREVRAFRKIARTLPETAARRIVRAIEKRSPRLLIGADAHLIDMLQRAFPVTLSNLLEALVRGRLVPESN